MKTYLINLSITASVVVKTKAGDIEDAIRTAKLLDLKEIVEKCIGLHSLNRRNQLRAPDPG